MINNEWYLYERDGSPVSSVGGVDGPENVIVPPNIELYKIMTTRLSEVVEGG